MPPEPAYRIERTEDEVIVRIRRGALSEERITGFLDFLVLEQIREKSELTEDDARALSGEIKRAAWERVRPHFEKREFGSLRGRLDLPGEFFEPLPEDEIDRWEQ